MNNEQILCAAASSQLVIIDVQEKLGKAMPTKVLNRVVENTRLLIQAARLFELPILATRQYPDGLGPIVGELQQALPENIQPFDKTVFSCAQISEFVTQLHNNGRPQIVLAGMEAHVCVLQTAFELDALGFKIFVVGDSICSRRLDNYQNALERLQQSGITVSCAESVIFEWLRDAKHAHFKQIADMLR